MSRRDRKLSLDLIHDERGIAMITSVGITFVVALLMIVALQVGDHMNASSRVDRKRVFSFHAAEAGVDQALAMLETRKVQDLPCDSPETGEVDAGPGNGTYSVTFEYYTTWPAPADKMLCEQLLGGQHPGGVVITSDGSTTDDISHGRRIQVGAQLSPVAGGSIFSKAMFSDSTLEFDNSMTVTGNIGNDGNVYTNGDYNCDNSGQTFGNVLAQGQINLSNACNVIVDAWANGSLSLANGVQVGRDAKSSTSPIAISNNTTRVGRNAIAGTTVSFSNGATTANVGGAVIQQSVQPPPPSESLPNMPYDEDAWVEAGYTPVLPNNCEEAKDAIREGWDQPTVVRITGCKLTFPSNVKEINMKNHLAIFSSGGITLQNDKQFKKHADFPSAESPPKLYLIVPSGTTEPPAPEPGHTCDGSGGADIRMSNTTRFDDPIETFVYSPCTVYAANSATMRGQIYGKTVVVQNSVNLAYRPMGVVPGAATETVGYTPSIAYKREISAS